MSKLNLTYSKEVLKHVIKPCNMGEIKNADGVGTAGNPICGDVMRFYIQVGKSKKGEEYIKDIKFQTLGCGAAIAVSSKLTTLVKGKLLKEAKQITKQRIIKSLGSLPVAKIHCSVIGDEAFKKAVADYVKKKR